MTRREHLRWLLAACRYWLTEDPSDAPGADPPDWHALAHFCYFHDLDPLLHHLAAGSRLDLRDRLPGRVRRQWEGAYYRNFVFNTELLDRVDAFSTAAHRQGLELRVFKGPVTLARGWIDPALRVMADADLICRRQDLPRLAELARAQGFETTEQTATHHLALRHDSLAAALELHFELYEVIATPDALLDRLWRRPDWVRVEDRRLPAPDPEIAAVLDVAHLLQHDLQLNLRPLLDLAATLWRQRETLDLERLRELLIAVDLEPEFERIQTLLSETLGLPTIGGRSATRGAQGDGLGDALLDRLSAADTLDRIGAMAGPHRRDGALAGAGYVLRRLFPPFVHLQAMSGSSGRMGALLAYPGHVFGTVRRGLGRWRSAGARPSVVSLKANLFSRRRG